jgi:hypothetical protein
MAALSFKRKVLILAVCIAVLAGTYILGLIFSPARIGRREAASALITGFNRQQRDRIAEIRISTDQGDLSLLKRGDSWILPGATREYPASATRIANNPDTWEEFEVHTEAPKRILLLDSVEEELTEIIVGKSGLGSAENYVRLGGSNEVLLANRSFDYYLNIEQQFWAYLRILPEDLDGQSIMRVTVDSTLRFDDQGAGPLQYTLVLSSEQPPVWKFVDGSEVELDNNKVDLLASSLADLEGTEFALGVNDATETGLAEPAARVLISTRDDRDFRLFVGAKTGDDQYYLAVENGSFVYKVSEWRIKGILKSIEELRVQEKAQ